MTAPRDALEAACFARYGPEFSLLREDEQLALMDAERRPIQAYLREVEREYRSAGPAAQKYADCLLCLAAELDSARAAEEQP